MAVQYAKAMGLNVAAVDIVDDMSRHDFLPLMSRGSTRIPAGFTPMA
jgi:hypothetical protein